ncbi:hypothetical protein D3C81_1035050 [compost metagenome]
MFLKDSPVVTNIGHMKSPQWEIKSRMNTVVNTGPERGTTIFTNVFIGDEPSIAADSRSSFGISIKN